MNKIKEVTKKVDFGKKCLRLSRKQIVECLNR